VQSPETYDEFIIGLTAGRALAGMPPVLSEEEMTHIEVRCTTVHVFSGSRRIGLLQRAAVSAVYSFTSVLCVGISMVRVDQHVWQISVYTDGE
jgi:hypothetical protein